MRGEDLIQYFIKLTGLPEENARKEINELLKRQNKPIQELCVDDLRDLLSQYVQDVILQAKKALKESAL